MQPIIVKELPEVIEYIKSRQIEIQYRKAKEFLRLGHRQKLDFKIRKPNSEWVYQFRINQKYRAFWIFRDTIKFGGIFVVDFISDHQD